MKNPISKIDALLDRLTPTRRDGVKGLLIAVALVALALIVRLAIAPVEAGMPFLTFFPAVTLAAVLGGFRASSFAMLACSVLASYLFFAPFQSFPMAFHADLVWANMVFYIEEMLVIVVVESMYHQRARYYTSAALFQELEAAKQEQKIAAVAFESQEGIMITDAKGIILRVNQACADLTGYSVEELVGQTPRLLKSGRHDADFYRALWQKVKETGGWQGEIWDRRKDGVLYLKWLSITAVKNELGVVTHYVSTQNDISDRVAAENKIQHLAFYDPLTQLPNRRLLIDRILQAMAISARSGKKGALLFIDLDHFKKINDTLGHGAGDLLLQQAAARLSDCVSEIDTVARMGGDEFVVLLEDLSANILEAAETTEHIAETILASLGLPYRIGVSEQRSTASIGITLFNGHDVNMETLLKQADIAMYQSKKMGRNTLHFFDPDMQQLLDERAMLEDELHKAIDEKQFQLHYQIQCNHLNQPLGAEALIRWIHPEKGMISPVKFIPLAEESNLILPLGKWVLETACAQLLAWQQNPATRKLRLSINVSAKQFRQASFVDEVKDALQRYAINPASLKLELTESMLLDNIENIIAKMNVLRAIGIRFSLDDFGTGYSSLQYLKRLPLSQLKIDQAFVRDLVNDSNDKAIVRTIIAMAESMELNIIAEGVETTAQRDLLLTMGCHQYQGYLLGRPMPIAEFEVALQSFVAH